MKEVIVPFDDLSQAVKIHQALALFISTDGRAFVSPIDDDNLRISFNDNKKHYIIQKGWNLINWKPLKEKKKIRL